MKTPRVLGEGLLLGQQIIHGRSPENIWRCSINSQNGKDGEEASVRGTSRPPLNKRASFGGGELGGMEDKPATA